MRPLNFQWAFPARKLSIHALVLVLLFVSAPIAFGQDETDAKWTNTLDASTASGSRDETQVLVTNVFYETSLRQALSDIAAQTGAIIIPDVSVRGVVTCELRDVELERALEIVLAGTGFVVKKTPDYYLICSASIESPSFPLISETRIVKLDYVNAEDAIRLLSSNFQGYVKAGKETDTNIISITAPSAVASRIADDLVLIDRKPQHVMLEARIVVLADSDILAMGIKWDLPEIQMGTYTDSDQRESAALQPDWPWGVRIGYTVGREFTESLSLTLDLLAQNDKVTMVSNPKVLAQDGRESTIRVMLEEYFEITTGGVYAYNSLEKIETGTILKITPRISDDQSITLQLSTEVSDVVARGENNLPVVTRRIAESNIRLADGGTAVVAGLMDNQTQVRDSKVPGFGDIPLIGELFKHDVNQEVSREVAVFVTATLLDSDGRPVHKDSEVRPVIELVDEDEFRLALEKSLQRYGRLQQP